MIKHLTLQHLEYACLELSKSLNMSSTIVPQLDNRYPGKLEQCLGAPFQRFSYKDLYVSFEEKASILFYLLIKNHPLENGNKRLACIGLLSFLLINDKWTKITPEDLQALSVLVAASTPALKSQVLDLINRVLRDQCFTNSTMMLK